MNYKEYNVTCLENYQASMQGLMYLREFHGNQLEALLLKSLDYFTDESTLDTIRLNHDVATLSLTHLA